MSVAFTQWPFDFEPDGVTAQETTEEEFRHSLLAVAQDGLIPNSGNSGGPSMRVTALDDSSAVEIASGYGQVRGYTCRNDTDGHQVSAPANAAADPRLYLVVLRLDRSARTITPQILEGAAASTPSLPAMTRDDTTWEIPLAQYRRGGGGGGITQLIDRRIFVNASGSLNTRSNARPVLVGSELIAGTRIFESDTGREMVLGTDGLWQTVHDPAYPTDWEAILLRSNYVRHTSGFTPAWRWVRPGRVELRGTIARSNGASLPDAEYYARVPVEARPGAFVRHIAASHARNDGESMRLEVRSTNVSGDGRIVGWHHYDPEWVALDGWEYDIS